MALRLLSHIELPAHRSNGAFDHADIHLPTDRIYVAHTSNDSIDVIDCVRDRSFYRSPASSEWQVRSSRKRAVSSSRAIAARIPSRYSRLVTSGMPSRSPWALSRTGSRSTPVVAF